MALEGPNEPLRQIDTNQDLLMSSEKHRLHNANDYTSPQDKCKEN